ncbi:MAG: biosynthetic-type acetolactate synthase large subunit [Spirochaetia bacterium]|nr:biosynthetic-type acetolactate synthase large subunit [Spirochaetia bacterium]MDD7609443.1 biosynthetic-type acetolactate synthase large subunit [Spirochaetales bacterium]MDY5913821.1 biosynthetic-type acetolactate synthase large subunit [Treponema sp.]
MQISGSQIVIECLIEQGVDTVFGYPGGAILNIYDALYKNSNRIRHILTAHEQGASHAADGYARSTGKVGVCMATSGPGATNLVTGIATAYMDSIPLVAITCNVTQSQLGKDSFQEIDITGVTMPITKHNFIVRDVKDLADTIRKAFYIAKSDRPGPVLIDIPKDITSAVTEYEAVDPSKLDFNLPSKKIPFPSEQQIENAAKLIDESQKPFIYAGGGVITSEASDELFSFATKANIPVAMSLMGKSAFPNKHELSLGMIGMHGTYAANTACDNCDLLLAIGCRFSDRVIGEAAKFAKNAKILQIDIDPTEVNKMINVDDALLGDIKSILVELTAKIQKKEKSQWNSQIEEWKKIVPPSYNKKQDLSPKFIFEYVNSQVKEDTIITTEVGQHQMWTAQFYDFTKPRTFLTSGGLGTMGFGTGAAIGAKFANPDKTVVHFAGDGSFRMNCNELATIEHYQLPIIIVILDNHALGNVRMWQTLFYEKRYSNTTLDFGPEWTTLASAYGIQGYHVKNEKEFKDAFDKALKSGKPAVIDAEIFLDEMVFPMIPPGKSIEYLLME